jgi:hypothetical protein
MATMIEPGGNQCMVQDASGRALIRSVGDFIAGGQGDAKILAIDENQVTVEYQGQSFTLPLNAK